MLQTNNLNIFYGDSHVVRDVSFSIPEGKIVCLMGRNGVGKTTVMKSLMGLLPAKGGSISFGGKDITNLRPYARARFGIGYAPQGREIIPSLTVEENLLIGLEAKSNGVRVLPPRIFELFPVLKTMLGRRGGDLSGGQQQQLSIGRALASEPKMLLLDEPTEGIQPSIIKEIVHVIKKLKEQGGLSILVVEQFVSFVRGAGDYFYIMEKGAIAAEGAVADLSDDLIKKHLAV
ncbi:MAG: urea ABC transporter ATP-binding subunit UrtE [Nitrospiraceae bacterium]